MDIKAQLIELSLWDADDMRDPSRDIAAAWEVVENLEEIGWAMRLHRVDDGWVCYLHHRDNWAELLSGRQPTAALAICHAALQEGKTMTPDELAEIKKRNEERRAIKGRATAGAYGVRQTGVYAPDGTLVCDMEIANLGRNRAEDNAAFFAFTRNDDVEGDVDRLVAEVEHLRADVSAQKKKG